MRSILRKISSWISAFIPQSVGRAFYLHMTRNIQKKAQKKWGDRALAWPRNSVLTTAFQPFVSDLDLSVFVPQKIATSEWAEFLGELKRFSLYFPWLGQVKIYDSGSRAYLESANFFTLQREPSLKDPLLIPERKPVKAEALVFLMKTLERDWQQLISHPLLRVNKWQVHWQAISEHFEGFKDFEMKEIFNRILHFASITMDERKSLLQYLNNTLLKKEFDMELTAALWRFFPQRFSARYAEVPEMKGLEAECLYHSICWEIWEAQCLRGLDSDLAQTENFDQYLKLAEKAFSQTEKELFSNLQKQIALLQSSGNLASENKAS